MSRRIPLSYIDLFCEYTGTRGLINSPYPGEIQRGKFKDSWVIFEECPTEGFCTVFVTRDEYRPEFENMTVEFLKLLNEVAKAQESDGAVEPPQT